MTNARLEARLLELRTGFLNSLPDRIAALVETLRRCQNGDTDAGGSLDRQFHNLAGTAGTFGFFSIAAAAMDGYEECSEENAVCGEARYLWSIVEELTEEVSAPSHFDAPTGPIFNTMNGGLSSMDQWARSA